MRSEVRQLTEADTEAYRALRLQGLKEEPRAFTAAWEYENTKDLEWFSTRSKNAILWGYFEGDALLGTMGLLLNINENAEKAGHRAVVIGVYVAPAARGKGVGRALLSALIAHAKTTKLEILQLGVGTFNTTAIALYESQGFERYGVEKHALKIGDEYIDEILMIKKLK